MLKILIIDDDKIICQALEQTFSSIGYKTYSAYNKKQAFNAIKKENPDVIFLDIMLLSSNQEEGLSILKKTKKLCPDSIIIIISEKDDQSIVSSALRYGAVEFITKPFSRLHLQGLIAKHIHKTRLSLHKGFQKPKILICDDEKDIHIFIQRFIIKHFIADVDISEDGDQAIKLIKKNPYDIVLMDIMMPGISGIEATESILKINSDIAILILSAWQGPEVTAKAIEAGAIDFLSKPVSPKILKARLTAILTNKNKLMFTNLGSNIPTNFKG